MLFGTEILTTAQMRAIESAAIQSGKLPGSILMERAGIAVAGHVRLTWPKPRHATILCGPGNNGGDGYVIARILSKAGWKLRVLGQENNPGPDADEARQRWRQIGPVLPLTPESLRELPTDNIFVDAIFGTGLTRPLQDEIAAVLASMDELAERTDTPVVAVDCPSGLCMDSGRWLGRSSGLLGPHSATLTVAFDSPKPGHLLASGPAACGRVIIADIGLKEWREHRTDAPELCAIWPGFPITDKRLDTVASTLPRLLDKGIQAERRTNVHKYTHGHAVVVAGAIGQTGAARLAARGAIRCGAGLVTLCPPRDALPRVSQGPDALILRGIDTAEALRNMLSDSRIKALCIGPGCGIHRAGDLLEAVIGRRLPCVLDADALSALARQSDWPQRLSESFVLTPHEGEFARLFPGITERMNAPATTGPAYSRIDAVRQAAAVSNSVVLLKGPDTVVAAPDGQAWIHSAHDIPWLATAGAGDVLAGIITGLLARGLPAPTAARIGCLIHAQAARLFGPGLIADDLPDQIPRVYQAFGI